LLDGSAESLLLLIDDLLDLAQIERGQFALRLAPVKVHDWLVDCADAFKPVADLKGVSLKVAIDPSVPQILSFDSHRLRQVLGNLMSNALKFTSTRSVVVRARACAEQSALSTRLHVEVQDTGKGIAAEALNRLFVEFSQENHTIRSTFVGAGLGLATSKCIIEAMKGVIDVRSEPGRGSNFWFEIPAGTVMSAVQ
jgi:signal transduction histidine kinase